MIQIQKLSKSFGLKTVLTDINMFFEKGKIYGLVGENGAGKTTLFRCLAGLEKYSGVIKSAFDNHQNNLGFLMTEPFMHSRMTGKEYLYFLAKARNKSITNIETQNVFDLPLNQYASTYSTGMKKKLALLGVLIQENDWFILDEPFNGVDIQSNILIAEVIDRLKDLDKTVIIASHIFSTLASSCDDIFLIKKGQIIDHVTESGFSKLEDKMKQFTITNQIDRLGLK